MSDMKQQVIKKTKAGHTVVGSMSSSRFNSKMEHLTCFVGGNMILGANTLPKDEVSATLLEDGLAITETCHDFYNLSPTGLGGEGFTVNLQSAKDDLHISHDGAAYILRPEVIESIYYAKYFTGEEKYKKYAHDMMK